MAVTESIFRTLALSQKGAVEGCLDGVPSFHVEGTVFASLPSGKVGVLDLRPDQQVALCALSGAAAPVEGDGGAAGQTGITLAKMDLPLLADYIGAAYRNVAPKTRLVF